MTLIEHLYELRHRLALAALAVVLGAIIGFLWFAYRVGPVPSLGQLMNDPYCHLPASQRVSFDGRPCALLQTEPFEGFMIRLKVGIAAGFVLTSPAWLYQIWAFITPGLYKKERKFALTFVTSAVVLFCAGAVMAYLVVPEALKVLSNVGGSQFVTALAATAYVSFMINLLVIFGVSFELPLLVVMLNRVGVLKYEKLKRWRRGMIFGLFVFAAFATPGQDPISMCALAGGLTLLLELAVQIARVHDKRKAQQRVDEGWDGLDDDEPSPMPTARPIANEPLSYDDAT
ncbi:MAG TPA: twin-arginine translocase subunit TatC [Pseudonocardiaceae bacterium]|jgi:sec-independent protein translocase protein TatC|nr:twin-arginine translocase subunit TatC [Pseudonocardiaceae bacterium]